MTEMFIYIYIFMHIYIYIYTQWKTLIMITLGLALFDKNNRLITYLYNTYHSCVYSKKLLMMEQDQDRTRSILILLPSCQQTCITYTITVRTVKNS